MPPARRRELRDRQSVGREGTDCAGSSSEPLLGSYFVSAYPPFDFWSESAVPDFLEALGRPGAGGFGLYVHVPFCSQRCQYCYYLSYDDRPGEIDRYVEALETEARLYAEYRFLAGRPLDFVYFGGGTPSLLSRRRIRTLLGKLRRLFPWEHAREVTFECAPRSVTAAKLDTLRELGVTRVSLGVQQLDDRVLRLNGRTHLVADVERAFASIREVGFPVVNVDLIVGLVGETERSFAASLERVIEMEPESVTLYLLEVPHNTPLFRALRDGAQALRPAGWELKRTRLRRGFARLEEAGYVVRSAYTAVRDPRRHAFVYQDEQYRGADLLGIGASAFSYLGGVHHQNRAALSAYLQSFEDGRLPLWRAHRLSARERWIRELVLQLKLGRADAAYFREKFGVDPRRELEPELERCRERGLLRVEEDGITLTRDGLSSVDRWVRGLFLPRHRGEPGAAPPRKPSVGGGSPSSRRRATRS